jgi:hypothetical protein
MGHPSRAVMSTNVANHSWIGVPEGITPGRINQVMQRTPCTACDLVKRNKRNKKTGSGVRPTRVGDVLSCDYQGKIKDSIRGFNGWYIFKCLFSGFRHGIMVKDKTEKTFQKAFSRVINFYNFNGHRVNVIRMDAGENKANAIM